MAIDVADQMDDLIVCFEDPENLMNLLENGEADAGIPTLIKNWQYRQQSIYSRAYLMSLNVGQDRPKSPSNKVIFKLRIRNKENLFNLSAEQVIQVSF